MLAHRLGYQCIMIALMIKKKGRVPEKNVNLNTLAERTYTLEAVCWYGGWCAL